MRQIKRLLCLLLVLLILPSGFPAAAESVMTAATAVNAATGESCRFACCLRDGKYWISLSESRKLTGLSAQISGRMITFTGRAGNYRYKLDNTSHFVYNGNNYYLMEEILDKACVQCLVNRAGELCLRPALANADSLIALGAEIFNDSSIDADIWESSKLMGDAAFAVATCYDILSGLRFDAMWGKAYYDDMLKLFLTLAKPLGSDKNTVEKVEKYYKKFETTVDVLQKTREGVEKIEALADLDDLPPGADLFLFGESWRPAVNDVLDAASGVKDGNACDEIFAQMVNRSDMAFYKSAMAEEGKNALKSYGKYGIGDILRVGGYIVSVINASQADTEALDKVISWYAASGGADLPLCLAGEKVVSDVRSAAGDDLNRLLYINRELVTDFIVGSGANYVKSAARKACLGIDSLWVTLEKGVLEGTLGLSTKTSIVRELRMYDDVQQIIRECFRDSTRTNDGKLKLDRVSAAREVLGLYLKCSVLALDLFDKAEMPTAVLRGRLDDYRARFGEFSAEDFSYAGRVTIPAGSLGDQTQTVQSQKPQTSQPQPPSPAPQPQSQPVIEYIEVPDPPAGYDEFLRSGDWIEDMDGVEPEDALWWKPAYSTCDVDGDGVPELIIQLNGCWAVYTRKGGAIRLVATGWLTRDMEVSVCPELNALCFEGGYTSWSMATYLIIRGGREVARYEREKEDPYYRGFTPEEVDPSLKGSYRQLEKNDIMGLELFA